MKNKLVICFILLVIATLACGQASTSISDSVVRQDRKYGIVLNKEQTDDSFILFLKEDSHQYPLLVTKNIFYWTILEDVYYEFDRLEESRIYSRVVCKEIIKGNDCFLNKK